MLQSWLSVGVRKSRIGDFLSDDSTEDPNFTCAIH